MTYNWFKWLRLWEHHRRGQGGGRVVRGRRIAHLIEWMLVIIVDMSLVVQARSGYVVVLVLVMLSSVVILVSTALG